MPFIQTVRRFDKRVLEWDGPPGQIPTLDKRFIVLDTTARWRIADPLRFLQSVGDERSAQSRLDDLINSAARDVISGHLLIQAVRTFARELPPMRTWTRVEPPKNSVLCPEGSLKRACHPRRRTWLQRSAWGAIN